MASSATALSSSSSIPTSTSSSAKKTDAVTVGVRIRPMSEKELSTSMCFFSASSDATNVQELDENGTVQKFWPYDHVFGPDCSNQYVFHTVGKNLVDAALEGYNTVLFMYGQTASGKTFTLFGGGGTMGVVNHAMEYVYEKIMNSQDSEYIIKMTYAELYNEELKDLLSQQPNENLKIIDDPNLGPTIQNITEAPFQNPAQVQRLLEEGEKSRHFGVTNMNVHSSRSHVLVRLMIETRKVGYKPSQPLRFSWGKDRPTCVSTLNLVDLAGSERAGKSGTSGQSLKEGSFINKSLLTLGTVISNLSEGKSGQHVPYRNSKLTRLLASALGGNAKTCMITCISPAAYNVGESLSTLRFASRAKRIVNIVHKNELQDVKTLSSKLALQTAEIDYLRGQLELSRQMGFGVDGEEAAESLKVKTAAARKQMRSFRSLVMLTPRCMSAFKRVGQTGIAKKMHEDFKLVMAGAKDAASVLEEHSMLVGTHLPREKELISLFLDIEALNAAEEHGDISDDPSCGIDELFPTTRGAVSDAFAMLDFGGSEELVEETERSRMDGEDFRSYAGRVIDVLKHQLHKRAESEAAKAKSIQDMTKSIHAQHDEITKLQVMESTLQRTIDDLKQRLDHEHKSSLSSQGTFQSRIAEMEGKLSSKGAQIAALQEDLTKRDREVARWKSQAEAVGKDLAASIQGRKTYEEDSIRARNDMKQQMDKIRVAMTNMLQQGGERSKVIEDQNVSLQLEVDEMKEKYQTEYQSKQRMLDEVGMLRGEIQRNVENEKSFIKAQGMAQEQISKLSQRVNALTLDLTQVTTQRDVEKVQHNEQQLKLMEEIRGLHGKLEECEKTLKSLDAQLLQQTLTSQTEAEIRNKEIRSLEEQVDEANAAKLKVTQTLSYDVMRLEKKISAMSKLQEDLVSAQNSRNHQSNLAIQSYQDEIRVLKQKLLEQQVQFDSMEDYIEDILQAGLENVENYDDDGTGSLSDVSDTGSTTYGPFTPGQSRPITPRSSLRRTISIVLGQDFGTEYATSGASVGGTSTLSRVFSPSPMEITASGPGSVPGRSRSNSRSPVVLSRRPTLRNLYSSPSDASLVLSALQDNDTASPQHSTVAGSTVLPPRNQSMDKFYHEMEDPSRFTNIINGLKLAQMQLTVAMNEDRLIREHGQLSLQRYKKQQVDDGLRMVMLEDQLQCTTERKDTINDSLVNSRGREEILSRKVAELEKALAEQKDTLFDLVTRERSAQHLVREYESQRSFLHKQLQTAEAASANNQRRCEDALNAYHSISENYQAAVGDKLVTESELDLVRQQICVLQVERDELVKRFLGDRTSLMSTEASPNRHFQPQAHSRSPQQHHA